MYKTRSGWWSMVALGVVQEVATLLFVRPVDLAGLGVLLNAAAVLTLAARAVGDQDDELPQRPEEATS